MQNIKKITKAEEVKIGDFVKLEDWDDFLEVTGLDQSRLPARIRITEEDYSSWYDISQGFIKQGGKEMDNFVMNVGINTHLQPGTKIRCVDNAECSSFLTTGKIYEVLTANSFGFGYRDDDGDTLYYCFDGREEVKFEVVQDNNEMKDSNTTNQTDTTAQPDEFRVGDEVWDVFYGKGKVTSVSIDSYPVRVDYADGKDYNYYLKDGRIDLGRPRTLFFSEPKIEAAVTRPFVSTLVGKRVVIEILGALPKVVQVLKEDSDRIYTTTEGHYWTKKDLEAIYEVSSENLLKK